MKGFAVLAFVFGIAQVVNAAGVFNPDGATYSCLNDDLNNAADDAVVFEYTEADPADTYEQAHIKGHQTDPACRADKVDGVITLTVNIGICGLVPDADNVVTVHVLLVQTEGFVTEWDYKFYFHCDFNEQTMQNVTANLTSILDNTQNGTVTQKVEDVSLHVELNANQGIDIPTCTLGDNINLRLDLLPSSSAVGTYGISCVVKPTMDSTRELAFISNRCAVTAASGGLPNFQGYLPADTGFGVNVNTAGFSSSTDIFKCFRFSDSDSLYFQCKVGFCSARSPQCDADNCAFLAGRRRRRDVDESETEEVIFRLDITTGSTTRIAAPARNEPNSPAESKPEHIYIYNTPFIAVIAILAVLLVVSMGSTMFVCMRMRRVRSGGKGEDNPAF